jgi:hypothetical protein
MDSDAGNSSLRGPIKVEANCVYVIPPRKHLAGRDYVNAICLCRYRLRDLNNAHRCHVPQQSR